MLYFQSDSLLLAVCILNMQRPGVAHDVLYPLDATY